MAIEKRFIHFKRFSDFNSKKLSANEANTQYTVGVSGAIQNGEPDILYQSYVWIKDTKQQWTHGQLYDGTNLNEAGFLAGEETSDQLDDVETHTYVKYVPQTLTDEQKAQTRINIDAISGSSLKTINGESIVGSGNITIEGGGGAGVKEIIEITDANGIIAEFMPNKIYVHTSPIYSIDILEYITTDAAVDKYITYFKTSTAGLGGSWMPYSSFPDGTLWANGIYPETEPNTLYELSIVKTTIDGVDYFKAVLTPFKPVE